MHTYVLIVENWDKNVFDSISIQWSQNPCLQSKAIKRCFISIRICELISPVSPSKVDRLRRWLIKPSSVDVSESISSLNDLIYASWASLADEVLNRDLTQKASPAESPIILLFCFYTIDVAICGLLRAELCLGNQSTTGFAVSRRIPPVLVTGKIHATDMQSPPLGARPRAAPQPNPSDFFAMIARRQPPL